MTKPTFTIPPCDHDEIVDHRVVRALQDSPLHVFSLGCMLADPEQPESEVRLMVTFKLITDGRRGFLVVSEDFAAPLTVKALDEFISDVCEDSSWTAPDAYAIRLATNYKSHLGTRGILDLIDGGRARAVLEAAYELAFADKPAIDHAAFLKMFDGYGWLHDETTERRELAELYA